MDVFLHELHADDLVRLGAAGAVEQSVVLLINGRVLAGGFIFLRVVGGQHIQVHSKR